jgi:hypothetical protein
VGERKEGKKENQTSTKPYRITMHVLPMKKKDIEKNQMRRQNHDFCHLSQPYVLFKVSGTIDALMCANTLFSFFFYLSKYNIVTKPTDYYEKTIIKLLISS